MFKEENFFFFNRSYHVVIPLSTSAGNFKRDILFATGEKLSFSSAYERDLNLIL